MTTLGGLAQVRQDRGDAVEAEKLLTRAIGIVDAMSQAPTPQIRAQQAAFLTRSPGSTARKVGQRTPTAPRPGRGR